MLKRLLIASWLLLGSALPGLATQTTLVTPSSPLTMTSLASFLNNALLSVGGANSGTSAPSATPSPFLGEQWLNTTAVTAETLSVYDGAQWVTIGTLNTTAHTWAAAGASLVGGTSPITGTCTSGYFLYNNSGTLGCQAINSTITASSTPTSGFSAGQMLYSDGSLIQATSGITRAGVGQLALALGTITTNLDAINITGTWNASGTTFDAPLFMNITNTASATGSLLADLQVGGTTQFSVSKSGDITTPNPTVSSSTKIAGITFSQDGNPGNTLSSNNGTWNFYAQSTLAFGAQSNYFLTYGQLGIGSAGAGSVSSKGFLSGIGTYQVMLSNGTNAEKFTVSESTDSFTSRTNYADFTIDTSSVANTTVLGTNRGGTSTWGGLLEFASLGTNVLDYGVTTASTWTFGAAKINVNGITQGGTASKYVCTDSSGNIVTQVGAC